MHQTVAADANPMANQAVVQSDNRTIHKADIWDGKGCHAQFVAGQIYPKEHDNGPDQWKLKFHKRPVERSALPADFAGFELYVTDTDGQTYGQATIQRVSNRARHTYVYIPQGQPAILAP